MAKKANNVATTSTTRKVLSGYIAELFASGGDYVRVPTGALTGWVPATKENLKHLLVRNNTDQKHNRHARASAMAKHIHTMQKGFNIEGEDFGGWLDEACDYIVSRNYTMDDGQHRLGARLWLYMTREEREKEFLRYFVFAGNKNGKLPRPLEALLDLPTIEPTGFLQVKADTNPLVFLVCDSDQLERKGVDFLTQHLEAGPFCEEADLSPTELKTILRTIYLRTTVGVDYKGAKNGTEKDVNTGKRKNRYGYMAKGGRPNERDYVKEFWPKFGNAIMVVHNCMAELLTTDNTTYSWESCRRLKTFVYALAALAAMGDPAFTPDADFELAEKTKKAIQRIFIAATKHTYDRDLNEWLYQPTTFAKAVCRDSNTTKATTVVSAIVHCLHSPKVELDTVEAWEEFLGTDPEQQPRFRLAGPDSNHV